MVRPTASSLPFALVAALVGPLPLLAQATQLRAGQTVQGTLAAGDTVEYTIEAGEDWFVFGEVDQISVDVVVRILAPDDEPRARVDGTERGPDRFSGETTRGGEHRIQVIASEDEAGDYAIVLHRLEPLETDPAKLVGQLMSPYDGSHTPGAAVQVWRDGETLFSQAYGIANLAYGIPFETDTRTNIGSTSKQFTAFAVMLQAERGALSLDDDIREHVPELPAFDHPITIRHLLTHTSGLREFLNLLSMAGRRLDHGDYIDRDEIIAIVQNQPALQNEPGSEWNYNNTAFALAALIVERTSGRDFHDYMRENVFEPLGMSRTMVRPHPEAIVPDHAQGYAPADEGYVQLRDLGGAVGAGAIYSTVEDLQKWVENYAAPKVGDAEMIEEMTTPYVLSDGDTTEYGYGLFVDEQGGLKRVHHGGADIAHRSMIAYYPEIGAGITTQSNHAGFDSNVAFRLAEAFFPEIESEDEEESVAEGGDFDPASYDPEDFDDYSGRYALDAQPSFILTFTREGDTLYTQATGQPRVEMVPTSDTTFALTAVEASLTFHRNEEGEVEGLTLDQGGRRQHATRLEGDVAGAWEPGADELPDFEGRYFSEEIETYFTVESEEEQLVLRHRRLDDVELSPGEEDTFSGDGITVAFERDRNGQVIGFYMSNVRTRDVRFDRVRY